MITKLGTDVVSAEPKSLRDKVQKWTKEHPKTDKAITYGSVAAGGLGVLSLLAGTGVLGKYEAHKRAINDTLKAVGSNKRMYAF